MALLILALAVLGLFTDKLDGDNFVELAGAVMLFYGAANVGEHFTKRQVVKTTERDEENEGD
jgi:hypothetical protein